jgi:hypothetical protein
MTQINGYVGAILQSTQVQRQQAVQKDRQVRRQQELTKNVAMQDDQLEHAVESSEELKPIHEERKEDHSRGRRSPRHATYRPKEPDRDEGESSIDITG